MGLGMLSLINQDGVVKVGNEIYMHRRGILKVIVDGDDRKIPLLSGMTKSDDDLRIFVFDNIIQPFNKNNNAREEFGLLVYESLGCAGVADKNRVTAYLIAEFVKPYDIYLGYGLLKVDVTNWYRDGLFGGYTRKQTSEMRMSGNVSVYEAYTNTTQSYSINYNAGSSERTRWTAYLWQGPTISVLCCNSYSYNAYGNLKVYSRGGTECGDIPYDTTKPKPDYVWH